MQYTTEQIATICTATIFQEKEKEKEKNTDNNIQYVTLDSRNIAFPLLSLFIALRGRRLDGHQFISEAYDNGIRYFLVSKKVKFANFPAATFFLVTDVIAAFQALAAHHRAQFGLEIIGITGSNGKTIIKEWLSQLLENEYFIVKSPRSYNSQIGVPLSVIDIERQHTLGIFEAGISQPNEMSAIAKVIRPTIGIFSNIGDAHSEGFLSIEEKIREKAQLFAACKVIIFQEENNEVLKKFLLENYHKQLFFSWSKKNNKNAVLKNVTFTSDTYQQTHIEGVFLGKKVQTTIPFSDYPSIENAIHCWLTMLFLCVEDIQIKKRMSDLRPVALRMEIKAGINNCLIINDSYNLDMTSLGFALELMHQQTASNKRTLILSDIFQTGLPNEQLYKNVAQLLKNKQIQRFIGIGDNVASIAPYLSSATQSFFFQNTAAFLSEFSSNNFQQETILLKGARHFEFEKIAAFLAQKAHRTVLEINLDALRHNLSVYNKYLQPNTKILVMVKASAYGSGSTEVAKLLEYQRVDYLGVAYTDEGVALRKEGIKLPILVLNPEDASFPALVRYKLEPEIYCLSQLQQLLRYLKSTPDSLHIHLKIDTGMHRLGFEADDIPALTKLLLSNPSVYVTSIFSHLAASETAEHDLFTQQQVHTFFDLYEKITSKIGYLPLRHVCNTGAIIRHPNYHLDMVRLGIGIYGIDSSSEAQSQLQVVNTLKATISQIKEIKRGETIGYSRKGLAESDLRIATISIGYADGLQRNAGNGRYEVAVQDQLAPIIGNVCMDMTMIDISQIPTAQEGDEVIIFGNFPTVTTLATATQTIPYEVFTSISERVKRVYFSL